jgi:hypothetical protein
VLRTARWSPESRMDRMNSGCGEAARTTASF